MIPTTSRLLKLYRKHGLKNWPNWNLF